MQTDQPGNTITSDQVAEGFKAAFREHPAGVALITANTAEGPVGLTASSVASVALDPVALTFSVTRATGSAGGLLSADTFLVHLLDARHVLAWLKGRVRPRRALLAAVALETDLQEALGDQKIDILLLHPGTNETPIHRIALKTGVLV